MYLKLRKFYSAASNQGAGGMVTLDVEKVKDALSKFDNLESSLKKIVNATNNSSSVKPADLINTEKVTITFDNGVEQKMLSNSPIKNSESSMVSSLSYIVIDRVRKLCDDIVKADSLQLTTTDEDDSLLDPITSSSSSEDSSVGDNQYTVGDLVVPPVTDGDKDDVTSGDYIISNKVNNDNISDSEIIVPDKGQYTIENIVTGIDSNGDKVTINPGNYDIVDTKKDGNGNITDICIMVNGEKIWVSLKDENVTSKEKDNINNKQYTIEDTVTIIDKNGNKITISPGDYEIVDTKKDANGNITDICIIVNGKKIWLTIINGNVVINNNLNIVNNQYNLDTTLTITSLNGNQIIIKPGSYEIVDIKKDANGNITAICIAADGNYVWLVINNGQITNTLLQTLYDGMYVFNDVSLNIYDNNGNIIGTITNGRYNIYEVIVDNSGKITWIRISKDGEPKYWINVYFQETDWGIFVSYESEVKHDSGVLKLFDKNKGPLIGVLGILVVGLGAIMYARKTKKSKNVDNGTFAVYEVNENEDGEISDVRVSPDDYEDEYWIKF